MKIQAITPFKLNTFAPANNKNSKPNYTQNNAYNPIAYNDLTFGARLFRSPENFYAQSFNKNGMPETMREYLNADYSDRQKMPPAQMLKLVFDDINETKNLEQVTRILPNEALFKNLTDTPNRKARTGVLAEIDLMREDGKTLFKNGKDNLGHYIFKKIYTEAKTLKEINEDFKKDVSVHYSGLSPIEYDTLRAFGIKFPNNAFWKSLTATREEFPYEYKPRKPFERSRESVNSRQTSSVIQKQRRRFENVKDWEIDRLSDAMIKGNGSLNETKKQLRKSSVRDDASLNFVAKYMGEINSVVLEKLHISPEMREFFENYDGLSKSQKQRLDDYWKNTDTKELRSNVMKSTIRFFFDVYGVDGQNDEFQELLEYAHNIKPNRIAKIEEHNRIQAEYDEMFALLDAQENLPVESVEKVIEPKSLDELLNEEITKIGNADVYEFVTGEDTIKLVGNLQEALEESLRNEVNFLPKQYAQKYVKFALEKPELNDSYILTRSLLDKGVELPDDKRLIPEYQFNEINLNLYQDFNDLDIVETRAAQQAVIEAFMKNNAVRASLKPRLFSLGVFEYVTFAKNLSNDIMQPILDDMQFINSKYNEYKKPLSDSEARKITLQIMDLLRNYNADKSILNGNANFKDLQLIFQSVGMFVKNKNFNKDSLRKYLESYVKEYGGSARYFLDNKVPEEYKTAKLDHFLIDCYCENPAILATVATLDKAGMNYIRLHNYEIYNYLENQFGGPKK